MDVWWGVRVITQSRRDAETRWVVVVDLVLGCEDFLLTGWECELWHRVAELRLGKNHLHLCASAALCEINPLLGLFS